MENICAEQAQLRPRRIFSRGGRTVAASAPAHITTTTSQHYSAVLAPNSSQAEGQKSVIALLAFPDSVDFLRGCLGLSSPAAGRIPSSVVGFQVVVDSAVRLNNIRRSIIYSTAK